MENDISREWFKNIWKNYNNDCEDGVYILNYQFETYFANYENRWFYEFKRFYEYCNVNKEFIGCNQALTEKQWDVLIWNMAFCHADLLK